VPFIRSWMSEALRATLAGFAIPFALLGLLAVFALGGGLGGLNSLGQVLAGPSASLPANATPAAAPGRTGATPAAASVLPAIPKLGDVHHQRVRPGHLPPVMPLPVTRSPVTQVYHHGLPAPHAVTAPRGRQPSGAGSQPPAPGPGSDRKPPPSCPCGPPPGQSSPPPDPATIVAEVQRQLPATGAPSAPPSAPSAPPDVIGSLTQLSGGTTSAPKP
jgi:hypothetical protein